MRNADPLTDLGDILEVFEVAAEKLAGSLDVEIEPR
jgi:hypothetical protein